MTLPHDHQISAWLADGAQEAPPEALARALAASRRTRKRPRWTFPERWLPMQLAMPRTPSQRPLLALATLALLMVALLATAVYVGQRRSLPAPLTERFDSTLNRISLSYPTGWQVRPATQPWNDRFEPEFDSPTADVIFDPALGDSLYLVLTSKRTNGRPVDEWHRNLNSRACTAGDEVDGLNHDPFTLDDARGFLSSGEHCEGAMRHFVELGTESSGYIIYLLVGRGSDQAIYDLDWFRSVLETVDLLPTDAR